MLELTHLTKELAPVLGANVRIFTEIIKGIYSISSGGVTMKNISRWTGKGGSYRNIQRFFSQSINWLGLNILLFQSVYLVEADVMRYVLAFDEVVEDKAGKHTYGVNWFYSSIASKVIRSVSNHVVSIVDTKREKSFVMTHHQTVKPLLKPNRKAPKKKRKIKVDTQEVKRKAGRPKGSKNKQNVKREGLLYTSFEKLLSLVVPLLRAMGMNIRYVLADGAYGNKTCCLIVRQFSLELISKLNRNTALYLPYEKKSSDPGRPKKYGEKIDYHKIGKQYLLSSNIDDNVETRIYQIKGVWTRRMPYLLNVVIIIKINLQTKKSARVVLFSTDLTLEGKALIRFYSLRFQIEFNFRDAKQYFGLSNFKNIKQQQVNNAIGMSFFMDNVSLILMEQAKQKWKEENISIQDLKAYFRAENYLESILNTLEISKESILIDRTFEDIHKIGAVNRTKTKTLAG